MSASVYHRLLQKQVAVTVMECNSEDKDYIKVFLERWITDIATQNFSGSERIYEEDV